MSLNTFKTTVATIIAVITMAIALNIIYPETLEVVDFRPDQGTVVLSTASGVLYEVADEYPADDVEYIIGELFSAIMLNSALTETILDDEVLHLEPSGFVTPRFVAPL